MSWQRRPALLLLQGLQRAHQRLPSAPDDWACCLPLLATPALPFPFPAPGGTLLCPAPPHAWLCDGPLRWAQPCIWDSCCLRYAGQPAAPASWLQKVPDGGLRKHNNYLQTGADILWCRKVHTVQIA